MRVLTGITPSGTPHLGNYIGALKPAIESQYQHDSLFFIADYHSLIKLWDREKRQQFVHEIAATWLALGLDPEHTIFYRQSDVPEIMELNWILGSVAAKGLLNRAHAYKDQVAKNEEEGEDADYGITMGLFNYPVLMAADILMFDAQQVPVGKDQIQHIEIARDLGQRFNHVYEDIFTLPEALINEKSQTIPGLDGRKMSKSYGNTIPLFESSKKLRKLIMKIKTNSQAPEEPKETEGCTLFAIYQNFASENEIQDLKARYREGIGWGEAKQILFEKVDAALAKPREKYEALMADFTEVDMILKSGAEKARALAATKLQRIRTAIGIAS